MADFSQLAALFIRAVALSPERNTEPTHARIHCHDSVALNLAGQINRSRVSEGTQAERVLWAIFSMVRWLMPSAIRSEQEWHYPALKVAEDGSRRTFAALTRLQFFDLLTCVHLFGTLSRSHLSRCFTA